MKVIDYLPIILAIVCYTLAAMLYEYNVSASMGLLTLGGALTGLSLPQLSVMLARKDQPKGPGQMPVLGVLLLGSLLAISAVQTTACHNVTPNQFFKAAVDCAKVNPYASAAFAAVKSCLLGVVVQNPSVCVQGLVSQSHFAVNEIACLIAYISQERNAKVASGLASDEDYKLRNAANLWLVENRIQIINTYPAAK